MSKEYDDITAFHYASYRPSLQHSGILKKCLGSESYDSGLDIGCGTGQSSIALTDFCTTVVGIDPSAEMVSKGIIHSNISYSFFDKNCIDFKSNTFDIITLAGSLWYAKSQELLNEIVRVGAENTIVLAYDFEILLEDIITKIGYDTKAESLNLYNHQEDFSGFDMDKIRKVGKESERVQIQIGITDLTHLILSVKEQYLFLGDLYGIHNLYDKIEIKLSSITDSRYFDIQANTFSTLYYLK